jgi:hypothetical protein
MLGSSCIGVEKQAIGDSVASQRHLHARGVIGPSPSLKLIAARSTSGWPAPGAGLRANDDQPRQASRSPSWRQRRVGYAPDSVARVCRLGSFRAVGCPSKNRLGDHPNHSSLNERPPQPRYDSFDQHFLITAGFVPTFVTLHFPTFATESPMPRRRAKLTGKEANLVVDRNLDAFASIISTKYERGEYRPYSRFGSTLPRVDITSEEVEAIRETLSDSVLDISAG